MPCSLCPNSAAMWLLSLLLFLLLSPSQAAGGGGAAAAPPAWSALPKVRAPGLEDANDVASFMLASTDVTATTASSGAQGLKSSMVLASASVGPSPVSQVADVELLSADESSWEADFATGILESKKVVEAEDWDVGNWVYESSNSGAAVPARMLHAEALLQSSTEAPMQQWKEKTAERGLRVYYHAKWLAERNYARAAEYRYREAAQLARSCRRSILASHSLARLGYFLVHWGRYSEAKGVVHESMSLNTKANPLAVYLHGVLERRAVPGDSGHLKAAEDQILTSGEQPSEELELERSRLIAEITYWRGAEASSWHCLAGSDAAHVLICLCGHAAAFLHQLLK